MNSFGKITAKSLHTRPQRIHKTLARLENCTIWGKPDSSAGPSEWLVKQRTSTPPGPSYYNITDPPSNFLKTSKTSLPTGGQQKKKKNTRKKKSLMTDTSIHALCHRTLVTTTTAFGHLAGLQACSPGTVGARLLSQASSAPQATTRSRSHSPLPALRAQRKPIYCPARRLAGGASRARAYPFNAN